jgi:CRISPR/Cas system CSM-associated protein Csm3 (group 7 of RAMP superfamily)
MDDKGSGLKGKFRGLTEKFADTSFYEKATHIKHKVCLLISRVMHDLY